MSDELSNMLDNLRSLLDSGACGIATGTIDGREHMFLFLEGAGEREPLAMLVKPSDNVTLGTTVARSVESTRPIPAVGLVC